METNKRTKRPSQAVDRSDDRECLRRRHIEDVPFYKLEHSFDDLPLDPFREFLNGKIREFRFALAIDPKWNWSILGKLFARENSHRTSVGNFGRAEFTFGRRECNCNFGCIPMPGHCKRLNAFDFGKRSRHERRWLGFRLAAGEWEVDRGGWVEAEIREYFQ